MSWKLSSAAIHCICLFAPTGQQLWIYIKTTLPCKINLYKYVSWVQALGVTTGWAVSLRHDVAFLLEFSRTSPKRNLPFL